MEEKACPKATRIGLRFDLPKLQLVHFVPPRRHADHYRPLPVSFAGITIQASESAKLLGVVLDHKLTFRSHVELAQKRGMNAMLALSRTSSPTFGLPHSYMRQLFQTVVIPRMEYALPVWFKPVMFGFMLIGLAWVIVFYVSGGVLPVPTLNSWNILIGLGIMFGLIGWALTSIRPVALRGDAVREDAAV